MLVARRARGRATAALGAVDRDAVDEPTLTAADGPRRACTLLCATRLNRSRLQRDRRRVRTRATGGLCLVERDRAHRAHLVLEGRVPAELASEVRAGERPCVRVAMRRRGFVERLHGAGWCRRAGSGTRSRRRHRRWSSKAWWLLTSASRGRRARRRRRRDAVGVLDAGVVVPLALERPEELLPAAASWWQTRSRTCAAWPCRRRSCSIRRSRAAPRSTRRSPARRAGATPAPCPSTGEAVGSAEAPRELGSVRVQRELGSVQVQRELGSVQVQRELGPTTPVAPGGPAGSRLGQAPHAGGRRARRP